MLHMHYMSTASEHSAATSASGTLQLTTPRLMAGHVQISLVTTKNRDLHILPHYIRSSFPRQV